MKAQQELFEGSQMSRAEAVQMTEMYLKDYFDRYSHVAIAFSGGKDSTALVSVVINAIKSGIVRRPKNLTVIYADTRLELPPLHESAMEILADVRRRGFNTKVAMAPIDKRLMTYILGRGVPPPNNNTLRYCTGMIKIKPMEAALADVRAQLPDGENLLMLTGVRLGESAVRDRRIQTSCSKDDGECGQGWFQNATYDRTDTLAPLIHWRVCHVWDWLIEGEIVHGFPTLQVAEVYGGDDAVEMAARTGCIGCPLASKDVALDNLLKNPKYAYLAPLKRLRTIYDEMRLFHHRLQKDGSETRKDGSLPKNPNRKGPLKLDSRLKFLDLILNIQNEIKSNCGDSTPVILINPEEEMFIRDSISVGLFPNGWSGNEPGGEELIPQFNQDGSMQTILDLGL
jgi:DNA sulfur modification protein DndC